MSESSKASLEQVAENVWTIWAPQSFAAFHIGTRMTVVKLSNGKLLLHSPVPLNGAIIEELQALGPVGHIVCPNLYHHMHASDSVKAFPEALLHGPAKLRKKRKDLTFSADLSDTPHADWKEDLELITVQGCLLYETVFFHKPSGTLISSDIVENFHSCDHFPTQMWLRLGGIYKNTGMHRLLKLLFLNRKAARKSMQSILSLPIKRAVIAHGDILTSDPSGIIRRSYSWLLS